MRRGYALALLGLLIALPALGAQPGEGFFTSNGTLVRTAVDVGGTKLEIYARPGVDVAELIGGIDLTTGATADGLSARIDAKRGVLYPNEEIVLAIAPGRGQQAAKGEKAGLVKAIYWWNNSNCSTCYWYAQYNGTVAVLFVDDVKKGGYKLYDRANSDWIYRNSIGRGGGYAATNYGGKMLRGFKGAASGGTSIGDVVMYFFQ